MRNRRRAPFACRPGWIGTLALTAVAAAVVAGSPGAARADVRRALAHHAVSTTSPAAQEAFDEGLTLVYAFNRDEARKRFERAAALDPSLGMAWWGVALAEGPNLNFDMDETRLGIARDALRKARQLVAHASGEERAYVEALARRYPADSKAETAPGYAAYRDAMKGLHDANPSDDDATTLYAESIMDVEPWDWVDGAPSGSAAKLTTLLEGVLEHDPQHVGANHYYVHVMDAVGVAGRALPSAERLSALPAEAAASHLVHMSGHIYLDVGRFAALERDNRSAVDGDRAFAAASGQLPTVLDYYRHNLDFYAGGALMLDDREAADRAASFAREAGIASGALGRARLGKWKDVLAWPVPAASARPADIEYWHYARGLAFVSLGDARAARAELVAYDAPLADEPRASDFRAVFLHSIHHLLAARLAHLRGDDDAATRLLRETLATTNAWPPEIFAPWYFPAGEWLGYIELGRDRPGAAEAAFRADLVRTPNNARTLFGLMESLSQQGRAGEARNLAKAVVANWRGPIRDLRVDGL